MYGHNLLLQGAKCSHLLLVECRLCSVDMNLRIAVSFLVLENINHANGIFLELCFKKKHEVEELSWEVCKVGTTVK